MKKLLLFGAIAFVLAACSKDKFETVPQVTIKEFGPEEVFKGQLIELIATVTDKEGDVQDSVYVVRKRFNASNVLLTVDTTRYNISSLGTPKKQEIDVQITFLYGELKPEVAPIQNLETFADRNFAIGLVVIDKAGNRSQYVESETIVLKKL